jgi:hypothetical protein
MRHGVTDVQHELLGKSVSGTSVCDIRLRDARPKPGINAERDYSDRGGWDPEHVLNIVCGLLRNGDDRDRLPEATGKRLVVQNNPVPKQIRRTQGLKIQARRNELSTPQRRVA